ncbi:hypothetical protein HNO53_17355 [Billgrantia antri]|uniref:Uncharacterized protein n=1 Tax=Halomonas sulfidivorans TaxID=2733488 RepID=A0ABX7WIW4_9GAMM|nr:hypothetical protein [Halomonas sulfidivorans]QTP60325.1 hypothetical protein HNO53_17355 [Halomonas sulfidivorans]
MQASLSTLFGFLAIIPAAVVSPLLAIYLHRGQLWKTKREQIKEIINACSTIDTSTQFSHADRAHLESAIYDKYGSGLSYRAVLHLFRREEFPRNIKIYAKIRRLISYENNNFVYKNSKLGNLIAPPTARRIKIYEKIGIYSVLLWGTLTVPITFYAIAYKEMLELFAAWILLTILYLVLIYFLGAILSDMRLAHILLNTNNESSSHQQPKEKIPMQSLSELE